jgi:hypothetical protein
MNGTYWSHVGIACGDGMVASARCDSGLLVLGDGGGVRLDPLSWYREELGRKVFVGRVGRTGTADDPEDPRFAERRQGAADFGRLLTGEPTIRRTRFSFSKTVLTGIARHGGDYWTLVSSEALTEILEQACTVGRSWEATPRWPVFASAEFVAAAYGLPFVRAALQGPMIFQTDSPPEPDLRAVAVELIKEQEPGRPWAQFADLLEMIERYEDIFLRETAVTFGRWWRRGEPGPDLVPAPQSSPKHEQVPGSDQQIGSALVSPRLLENAWWVEKILAVDP